MMSAARAGIIPQAEEAANTFYEKLKNGGDFAALARQYSQNPLAEKGGYIGEVDEENSSMGAIFDINAFALKEGEFTKPLSKFSKGEYVIIKVDKVIREKKLPPFPEVRNKVEEAYKNSMVGERLMKLADEYLEIAKRNVGETFDNVPPLFNFSLPFIK